MRRNNSSSKPMKLRKDGANSAYIPNLGRGRRLKAWHKAVRRVGMMVAAREAAMRMSGGPGGSHEALDQVEHEIRSLGGAVPHSLEEAQNLLQQLSTSNESLADIQQQMNESRDKALAARNQVNVTMEAVAAARKERARLQELNKKDSQVAINEKLRSMQTGIQQVQQEIV